MSDPERPTPELPQVPEGLSAKQRLTWVKSDVLLEHLPDEKRVGRPMTYPQMELQTEGGRETNLARVFVEATEEYQGRSFSVFLVGLREGEVRGEDPAVLAANRNYYEPTILELVERHLEFTDADPTHALFFADELQAIHAYFEARGENLPKALAKQYAALRENLAAAVAEPPGVEEEARQDPVAALMEELGLDEATTNKKILELVRQYARLAALGRLEDRDARRIQGDLDRLLGIDAPDAQILPFAGYLQGLQAAAVVREQAARAAQRGPRDKGHIYADLVAKGLIPAGLEISSDIWLSAEDERLLLSDPLAWFRERFKIVEDVGEAEVGTHFQNLQNGYRYFFTNKGAYAERPFEKTGRRLFEVVEEEYGARISFIHVFRSWVRAHSYKDIEIDPEVFRHGRFEWLWKRLAPVIWELERPDHIRNFLNAEERTDRLAAYLGDEETVKGHGAPLSQDNIHKAVNERWGDQLREAWGFKEGEEIPFWVVKLGYFFWRFNGRAALFDATAIDVHKILAVTGSDSKQAQEVKSSLEKFLDQNVPGLKAKVRTVALAPDGPRELEHTAGGKGVRLGTKALIDAEGNIVDADLKRQVVLHYVEFGTVPKALTVESDRNRGTIRVDIENPEQVMRQIPEFSLEVSGELLTAYLHRRGAYDTVARKLFALDYNYLARSRGVAFARQALKTGFYDYFSYLEHRFKNGDPDARALSDKKGEAILVRNPREFIGAMAYETGAKSLKEERDVMRQMMNIRFTDYKDTDISDWVGSGVTLENALENLETFLADPGSFISTGNRVFFDLYTSDKLVFLLYQNPLNPRMLDLGVTNRKEEFILNLLKVAVSGLIGYSSEEKENLASNLVRTTFIDPTGGPHKQFERQIEEKFRLEARAAYVMGTGWYVVAKAKSAASDVGSVVGAAFDTLFGGGR